jgi:hypothetical protein
MQKRETSPVHVLYVDMWGMLSYRDHPWIIDQLFCVSYLKNNFFRGLGLTALIDGIWGLWTGQLLRMAVFVEQ